MVAHTARGGKGVVDEGEVVKKEGGGAEARGRGESGRDRLDRGDVDRGVRGRVRKNELANLVTAMLNSFLKVNVFDNGLVHSRTCVLEERSQGSILEVAISPEVSSGSVAVVTDELAVNNGDRR